MGCLRASEGVGLAVIFTPLPMVTRESCGGTKLGSGAPRRDGPDLTACEAERLMTRGIMQPPAKGIPAY